MKQPVILSACRTPIGKFGKSLAGVSARELATLAVREAISRAKIRPIDVEEVVLGNVLSAGLGMNLARQAAVYAGVPYSVGAFTINKVCGSGLKAVMLAAQAVKAGDAEVIVAGGAESMSNSPYLVKNMRWGTKFGDSQLIDAMIGDGLWDVFHDYNIGMTGELIAEKFNISRVQADEFSYQSNMKASDAWSKGKFNDEVVPVRIERSDGSVATLLRDEGIHPDTTVEKLSKLPPVFKPNGILTAGNSSQLSDGAAALVIASEEAAEKLGAKPLAKILSYGTGGVEPGLVMEAPIPTTKALLSKSGMTIDDIDYFEHNEAYSTASIAVRAALGVREDRFNVNGGAVAFGHPLGCTGARILTTLLYTLKRTGKKRGLATLCLGGGNAVSMIVEQ
jgi:acetyl-CoA C-acetyltransferase